MDKTRAAARQANAMQKLAEHLPSITDRLAAIEQQLAAPAVDAGSGPLATEPPATAVQIAEIAGRLDALVISLMPAIDLVERFDTLSGQLSEIKALLTKPQQPQNQRR